MAVVRFTIGLMLLATTCSAFAARPEKPVTVVADLRYGTALYNYWQGEFLDALLELKVAEARGGIVGHGNRPRVMEGSFSLAYGMEHRANDIFDEVLNSETKLETRDSAWFYLAKIYYLGQDWQAAEQALTNVSEEPPAAIAEELAALRINLSIRQGDLETALQQVQATDQTNPWLPYVYYNLGAAQSRSGNYAAAIPYYNHIAEMSLASEEHLALYDKAMTAAGYGYLLNQQFPEAQAQLSRVRLSSPLSNRAMLGYGWAAAEQDNYLEALAPWQHLAKQSLTDANTLEALLAVPFAYEQIGNQGLALQYFEQSEQRLDQEIDHVQAVISRLRDSTILDALHIRPEVQFNRLDHSEGDFVAPDLAYLTELFAHNRFQEQVQDLRDLVAIRDRFHRWAHTLELYATMLDERELARKQRVSFLQQQQLVDQIASMRSQRQAVAQELERIVAEADFLALAPEQQTQLWQRVESVRENIDTLAAAGQATGDYQEALRRYAGLIQWQVSEAYAERKWAVEKNLAELDEQLDALESTRARVEAAVNAAQDLQPYRNRIASGTERLEQQLQQLDTTIARIQGELRQQVTAVLEEQQERLHYYLAQARLSIARLYDSAWVEPQ